MVFMTVLVYLQMFLERQQMRVGVGVQFSQFLSIMGARECFLVAVDGLHQTGQLHFLQFAHFLFINTIL